MNWQNILEDYRKYDFLNAGRERPLVKILVSYIKPSFLFKSDILVPIHLGRAVERAASKDGVGSDEDIRWLHENCLFGDDDVEGSMSGDNRRLGFFTGTYWAWKNYARLGDPEFFGSFGYRKLFHAGFLAELPNVDVVMPELCNTHSCSLKDQTIQMHGRDVYEALVQAVDDSHPDEAALLGEYLNERLGYFHELYVMRKSVFFDFCEWLYPMVKSLLSVDHYLGRSDVVFRSPLMKRFFSEENRVLLDEQVYGKGELRDVAFVVERLTGFYLYQLRRRGVCKCLVSPLNWGAIDGRKGILRVYFKEMRERARRRMYADRAEGVDG